MFTFVKNEIVMRIFQPMYLLLLLTLHSALFAQQSKEAYLKENGMALSASYTFPKNMKIIGFGAFHGSAKTEDAELLIVESLIKNNGLSYYFPETDCSIAHYFDQYLTTGDEALLKDLIETYGTRVPQERTIEVFNKWKKLKALNDKLPNNKKIKVLGADPIVTYKYTYKHLLSLISIPAQWKAALQLQETVAKDTTDYSPYYESYSKNQLKIFVADYNANIEKYKPLIIDKPLFDYIIATIKVSFDNTYHREKEMYNNYLNLVKLYKFEDKLQFFRLGFAHLLKTKEGKARSLFCMLADNNIYPKNEIVSILGYLTKSEVIWDEVYDANGEYRSYTTSGDEGIGDSPTEYFRGIDALKAQKKSDLTIFRMNAQNTPYNKPACVDMVEIISVEKPIDYGTTVTTDFIDYALLISNSAASRSIYSVKK